jgi:ribosomal protein S18 acetylase RimI-like enzyme
MSISIREVEGKKDLRTFIFLPAKIHADHKNWMPPLYMDEWDFYNPAKNKAFSYCDTILLLAYRENKPVGRIMGIINRPYNESHGEKTVRFEHLEAYDDEQVVHALLDAIEKWGLDKGMNKVVGPFGFSDKDPEGLQIDGFDHPPVMVTACNLPYLPKYVESRHYEKKTDCLDYLIDLEEGIPEIYGRIFERILKNTPYVLKEFTKTSALKPYIIPVFELINKTYKDLYGFHPMDEQEMKDMASRYLPILDPRFVKMAVDKDDTIVAFVIGLPNMTKGFQRSRGKLLPFGLFHILYAVKTAKQLDMMLGAVDESCRGRGLDILIGWTLMQSARKAGMKTMETHLVLETNTAMRAEYERMGAKLIKRFRIFQKDL